MMERPYRLSARFVATVEQPGRYGDGRGSGGLSLLVKHTARGHLAKSWAQRISVDGRPGIAPRFPPLSTPSPTAPLRPRTTESPLRHAPVARR